MFLTRVSSGASLVGLPLVKEHLREDSDDNDTLIAAMLASATEMVGERTGIALRTERWSLKTVPVLGVIPLPKAPATALVSVGYISPAGASETATLADFRLMADDRRPWVEPIPGKSWPATETRPDAITITFDVGVAAVPDALITAILMLVGHWYLHREEVGVPMVEIPQAASALIDLHRSGWFAA